MPNPGDPQAWNRYGYVLNNPLRFVDPTGHYGVEACNGVPDSGRAHCLAHATKANVFSLVQTKVASCTQNPFASGCRPSNLPVEPIPTSTRPYGPPPPATNGPPYRVPSDTPTPTMTPTSTLTWTPTPSPSATSTVPYDPIGTVSQNIDDYNTYVPVDLVSQVPILAPLEIYDVFMGTAKVVKDFLVYDVPPYSKWSTSQKILVPVYIVVIVMTVIPLLPPPP